MFMSFQSLPTLKAFCPLCSCPGVNNFLLSLLLIVFALCPSFNGLAPGRGMGGRQRGQCILFSVVFTPSTSPPPQPPRQCLSPTCHLSTLYRRYGLALSYDGRGFVGPKKKTIVSFIVFNLLWGKERVGMPICKSFSEL